MQDLRDKEQRLAENQKKIDGLGKEATLLETLRGLFRNIPENILRRLRPFVERESADVINDLSNGEITALDIEEETLGISATTGGEMRPIHYFSGGQKTRINMALRIAISRILSKLPDTEEHTFAVMNTLFIDEGDFGDLDEAGIQEAVSVIRNLIGEFSRVILVSHVQAIKDLFHGQVIEVVKTNAEESALRMPLK